MEIFNVQILPTANAVDGSTHPAWSHEDHWHFVPKLKFKAEDLASCMKALSGFSDCISGIWEIRVTCFDSDQGHYIPCDKFKT